METLAEGQHWGLGKGPEDIVAAVPRLRSRSYNDRLAELEMETQEDRGKWLDLVLTYKIPNRIDDVAWAPGTGSR